MLSKNLEDLVMNEINELLTIRDFIRWSVSRFNESGLYYGHGTDNAWDESVALILHTLFLPHQINSAILEARITTQEREQLYKKIRRRIDDRLPVAYLTNESWFAELPFYVDERVLIPRSPIAELIQHHFEPWIEHEVETILDLCTGSGCIAVACAKAFPDSIIDASDISTEALAVAKINVLRHEVEDQVHLHQADLFKGLPAKKYDIIVSNPPYVNELEMSELPPEFHHEPTLGLQAGKEGLDIVINILREAHHHLKPQGILIVEVGNSEYALVEKFPDIPFTWLEFKNGGGGVFLLTAKQLIDCQDLIV